jgi:drug/metabolite transporter (DMT)-like permease
VIYVLVLTAVTAVWGWTFVVVKDAVAQYPVAPFLALRFAVAVVVLLALARRLPQRRSLAAGTAAGVALAAGYALQTYGLQSTEPGTAGLITGLFIVFTPLLEGFLGFRVPLRTWVAVLAALAGTALLAGFGAGSSVGVGDLLVLASAVCWAAQIVILARRGPGLRPTDLAILQVAVSLLAFTAAGSPAFTAPTATVWFAVAVTGVLASALAFPLQAWAQARLSATRAALIMALEPAWALMFSVVLAGQRLDAIQGVGTALVLAAVIGHEAAPLVASRRAAGALPAGAGAGHGDPGGG